MGQSVFLVGYMGEDAPLYDSGDDGKRSTFSFATHETISTGAHTEWHRVTAWGSLAEICAKYATKGRLMEIAGVIRRREFTGRDGQKRFSTEIHAHRIQFLSGGASAETSSETEKKTPVEETSKPTTTPTVVTAPAPEEKKRRGRPPGSKNKPKLDEDGNPAPEKKRGRPPGSKNQPKLDESGNPIPPKKRGRPPGSKNKPKASVAPEEPVNDVMDEDEVQVMTDDELDDLVLGADDVDNPSDEEEVGW